MERGNRTVEGTKIYALRDNTRDVDCRATRRAVAVLPRGKGGSVDAIGCEGV